MYGGWWHSCRHVHVLVYLQMCTCTCKVHVHVDIYVAATKLSCLGTATDLLDVSICEPS